MTTVDPQPAWRGRFREAWHGFRRWRRVRPFWGGLLIALAGVEILGATQMSLGSLTFQLGPAGFLSWVVPTVLVACGLLLWFSPQQGVFYAVVASATALFSLVRVDPGGFFVGLLLGLVGGALGFAWTPDARPTPSPGPAAGPRVLRPYVVLPVLLAFAAAVALAAPGPRSVQAVASPTAACPTTAPGQGGTRPAPSGTPGAPEDPSGTPGATPAPARTPGAPTPTAPSPSPSAGGGRDILGGIGDLLDGGRGDDEEAARRATPTATPSVRPTATPSVRPTATPSVRPTATGRPAAPGRVCAPASPKPGRPGQVVPGRPLPRIAADPGQPMVAAVPSKLTGSEVTMVGLRFEGTVDLPTADSSLRALKFTMDRAVTDDFLLRSPGPADRTMRFATDRLTVQGDVAFYATRFVGRLLGIEITLAPDLPFPDGLPITSPVPITFTEPAMELAFVTSDTLTARPALELTLS
ncbi:DUF6114 domain-containing protein [Micromonospora sp. LOL_025]|uniref:DUF6114 domain-containing protein n=1 Tax=Micromonospora sp. LOL_025 TaxID=3345413 RepID=UPI003A8549B6